MKIRANRELLKALDDSLAKWQFMAWTDTTREPLCELCEYSIIIKGNGCFSCPIYDITGEGICQATPYYFAMEERRGKMKDRYYRDAELQFIEGIRDIVRFGLNVRTEKQIKKGWVWDER